MLLLIVFVLGIVCTASGAKELYELWKGRTRGEYGPAELSLFGVLAFLLLIFGIACILVFAIYGDISFFFGPSYGP